MKNKWSDSEAESLIKRNAKLGYNEEIALRVYTSRLIGSEPSLVLHGGGNTSVKSWQTEEIGQETEVLCIKASGRDLADLEPEDLPAVRLEPLQALRTLESLSDEAQVKSLRKQMLDPDGPVPSVEALLHAFLPHKYIDHSHADAILSLIDQADAEKLSGEIFENRVAMVPYVMSGLGLAKLAANIFEQNPEVQGLLLMQHGLVTFGKTAHESYVRHIELVDLAEDLIRERRYWKTPLSIPPPPPNLKSTPFSDFAPIVRGLLGGPEHRCILNLRQSKRILEFVDSPKLASLSQRGVATPDHVIRTKHLPLILDLTDTNSETEMRVLIKQRLGEYRNAYDAYVERNATRKKLDIKQVDADPRVILIPGLGMVTAGCNETEAAIAADIYEHTIDIILNAESIDSYQPVSETDVFDIEYWSLEQAKVDRSLEGPLQGRVVYITGAASGIGAATARHFAQVGSSLYLVDSNTEDLEKQASELGCAWEVVDLTDEQAVRASIDRAIWTYGGLDGAVSNAGNAPQSPIHTCSTELLHNSFQLNLYAHQWVASSVVKVLLQQGNGGFLLFNASKAAFNPGAEFGPYAIPKSALIALMKQYAIDCGQYGIRSNAINADRIRTGLFSEDLIQQRAQARGLKADDYFKSNLLRREVTADDVAKAFLSLALSESTTGCVMTVDGGNIAASPR